MMRSILLLILIQGAPLFAADTFLIISTPGKFSVLNGKEEIELNLKGQELTLVRGATGGGVSFLASKGWKVYSDSESVLWVFDGINELRRLQFEKIGIRVRESHDIPELWQMAPKSFLKAIQRKSEQTDAANSRASGTSGTSDAGASAPPEASGNS